jgi:hypothetical protein
MSKAFKEVKYRVMFPTDVSPNKVADLLSNEFAIEKFEKDEEIIIFADYKAEKKKKIITGRYKAPRIEKLIK